MKDLRKVVWGKDHFTVSMPAVWIMLIKRALYVVLDNINKGVFEQVIRWLVIPTFHVDQTSVGSFCPDGEGTLRWCRKQSDRLGSLERAGTVSAGEKHLQKVSTPATFRFNYEGLGPLGQSYRKKDQGSLKEDLSNRTASNTVSGAGWMFGLMAERGTPGDGSQDLMTSCQGSLERFNYCLENSKVIPSNSWAVLFPSPLSCHGGTGVEWHSLAWCL